MKTISLNTIVDCKDYYIITDKGAVFSTKTNKELKLDAHKKTNGTYYRVSLRMSDGSAKKFFIHRLIMMAFSPTQNMEELEIDHIDRNPENNSLSNLRWCTRKENANNRHDSSKWKKTPNGKMLKKQYTVYDLVGNVVGEILTNKDAEKYVDCIASGKHSITDVFQSKMRYVQKKYGIMAKLENNGYYFQMKSVETNPDECKDVGPSGSKCVAASIDVEDIVRSL